MSNLNSPGVGPSPEQTSSQSILSLQTAKAHLMESIYCISTAQKIIYDAVPVTEEVGTKDPEGFLKVIQTDLVKAEALLDYEIISRQEKSAKKSKHNS